MLDEIKKLKNDSSIVFIPASDMTKYDSINDTLGNVIKVDDNSFQTSVTDIINKSKIKKIYLFGCSDFYRLLLPRIKKSINVCWVYTDSFSNLSNSGIRSYLNAIFEYYDRKLIDSIGLLSKDNEIVLKNSGYNCEYIDLKIKKGKTNKNNKNHSNSIGILSNDFDPNNNFYNQLASLTFLDYDVCKFKGIMRATNNFYKYFNIKAQKLDNFDDIMKDNFVNLYINFTNTNKDLIMKSYSLGVPVIVGNTDFYDNIKYLKEKLVVKSDDDINELVEKIKFVKCNYNTIMEEYNKL